MIIVCNPVHLCFRMMLHWHQSRVPLSDAITRYTVVLTSELMRYVALKEACARCSGMSLMVSHVVRLLYDANAV